MNIMHWIRKSRVLRLKNRPGLTMIELLISLLIIAITSVAVMSGVATAYGWLLRERHKQTAVQYIKEEMEFWQARIHSAMPPEHMFHNATPRDICIDDFGTAGTRDDLWGTVRLVSIERVDLPDTSTNPDWFELKVICEYEEPPWDRRTGEPKPVVLELTCPMVPSTT